MALDHHVYTLEREADAARLEFRRLLGEAAESLSPSNLRREAGETVSRAAAFAAETVKSKISSPASLALGGAGLAVLLAAAFRGRARMAPTEEAGAARFNNASETAANSHPAGRRNAPNGEARHPSLLLTAAAALGAGMILDRLTPVSEFEITTLKNIRPEIHKFASDWVSSRIKSSLTPGAVASGGALNLLLGALGVAAALSKSGGAANG